MVLRLVLLAGSFILPGAMTIAEVLPYRDAALPVEKRVEDLLSRMTLAEKIGQLSMGVLQPDSRDPNSYGEAIRSGTVGAYILSFGSDDPAIRNSLQGIAIDQSRLGIPLVFGFDVIHGLRTVFPIPLALSCAWDPDLFERADSIAAREARAAGINWVFSPMCDLARDPRWGRVAETFGEDPFLGSLYVAAGVRGLQGAEVASGGVAACLKHFAGYSAGVGGRDYNHTEIPEFTMRNFHLLPFHAGVRAGALTVMSSFNANDGIPASANSHLLTDVLRGEWGFRGFVVSDWQAVLETILWGYAADAAEAARRSITAGTDMEMVSTTYRDTLAAQLADGQVSGLPIDEAVRRILNMKLRIGLFENPFAEPDAYRTAMLRSDAVAWARECARRSSVLLANNGVLPLPKTAKRVAVIGPFADDPGEMLGSWSGHGSAADVVTLANGIRAKLPGADVQVVRGCDILEAPRTRALADGKVVPVESLEGSGDRDGIDKAVRAASNADAVVLALGEPAGWSGENASRAELGVTGRQRELFDAVAATGKDVVAVIYCGRPLALRPITSKAAAVLVAWQPGIQGGNALADLLFGDAAPSGRLTMSFPVEVGQVPVYYNRYATGRPLPGMVDYRDLTREPLFPFGFGLTYTSFTYSPARIVQPPAGGSAVAAATITNSGPREGEEVAQLYIRDLACSEGARPEQELRGFQRVRLRAGEHKEIQFPLTDEVLGFFGRDGWWRVEPGKFHVWIAPHAHTGTPASYDHNP